MLDLIQECQNAKTIGISGHIRPDGDCIGSTLALYLYLKKIFPETQIDWFLEEIPDCFRNLKGIENLCTDFQSKVEKYDVFFAVDCGGPRLGKAEGFFKHADLSINIDHHISNPGSGKINYIVPEASSASELVYELLNPAYLDQDIAIAIYMGIIHDTGVFQYSNTSPKTLRIAAQLLEYPFDFPKLIEETFYEKTHEENRILGEAIRRSSLYLEGKVIVSVIYQKDLEEYGVKDNQLDGIVSQLRITKGVECAIFLHQSGEKKFKVSLRSNGLVNVAKAAECFDGGGHVRAAGCVVYGEADKAVQKLLNAVEKNFLSEKI